MYNAVLVIPVPEENRDAYREWAEKGAAIFKKYGCMEIVDCWDDYVPIGKQTDFYRLAEPFIQAESASRVGLR